MEKPELNALNGMNREGLSAAWSVLYKEPLPAGPQHPAVTLGAGLPPAGQ